MLQAVGVSEFDEQVYRAMLRRPTTSTAELAELLHDTPSRIRGALVRLERIGLVRRGDSRRAIPIAPETALAGRLRDVQTQAQAKVDALHMAIDELTQDYRTGELRSHPVNLIEMVIGAEAIHRRSVELWQAATREILVFDQPPFARQVVDPHGDEVTLESEFLRRGVRVRGIYSQQALDRPGRIAIIKKLSQLGEEARTLPRLPIKLHIYDRRTAMVPLITDTSAAESRAVIHASGLLEGLIALFEAYWQRAFPIGGLADGLREETGGRLSEEETTVLQMLAAGMKDHAIARQLNVSRRTASRRIEEILDALDASTRFQAGAQAARRAWI